MEQSKLLEQLADFVYQVANQEPKPSKDQINLALANWVIDNDITVFKLGA